MAQALRLKSKLIMGNGTGCVIEIKIGSFGTGTGCAIEMKIYSLVLARAV
jgi:hypothetical protein